MNNPKLIFVLKSDSDSKSAGVSPKCNHWSIQLYIYNIKYRSLTWNGHLIVTTTSTAHPRCGHIRACTMVDPKPMP